MKDVFEQDSVRPNSQLLAPTATVPNGHIGQERTIEDANLEHKRDAEGMVRFLQLQSKKPCLMVDSQWTAPGERFEFPQMAAYQQAAQQAGLVLRVLSNPEKNGMRHMLFLGKNAKVKDTDYLKCVPASHRL